MPVSSTVRIAGPFTGSGTVSTFPFPFIVFETSDLLVVTVDVNTGIQSTLDINTDYTATLNANQDYNPGGSITLSAGPLADGYSLAISSNIAQLQGTELTNQGGFYPEVLTDSLDLLTILIQQMQELLNRTMSFPITDPSGINTQLPPVAQREGMYLFFDDTGAPQVTSVPPTQNSILYVKILSAAGQTVFPTPLYTPGANNLFATAGGLFLTKGVDYTETSMTSITLTQPSLAGEVYTFRSLTPLQNSVLFGESVSAAGQTVFPTPLYTPGANNLFATAGGLVMTNGVDYTETSPTSITLTQPSPEGEFYTFRSLI